MPEKAVCLDYEVRYSVHEKKISHTKRTQTLGLQKEEEPETQCVNPSLSARGKESSLGS